MDVVRREFDIGVLSTSRHRFYERLGWERWTGPSFVLRGGERIRTADEDDGIVVLRFGVSLDIPLSAAIACHARSGDDG
jgi:aminoglycoside 2'-N-acetyltransferase I